MLLTSGLRRANLAVMKRTKLIRGRNAANLSQQELAERCSVSRWTINRIELGERDPSFSLMQKIVAATDGAITLEDFLFVDAEPAQ